MKLKVCWPFGGRLAICFLLGSPVSPLQPPLTSVGRRSTATTTVRTPVHLRQLLPVPGADDGGTASIHSDAPDVPLRLGQVSNRRLEIGPTSGGWLGRGRV